MKTAIFSASVIFMLTTAGVTAKEDETFRVDCPHTSFGNYIASTETADGPWEVEFQYWSMLLSGLKPFAVEDLDGTQRLTCVFPQGLLDMTSRMEIAASSCEILDEGEPGSSFLCRR